MAKGDDLIRVTKLTLEPPRAVIEYDYGIEDGSGKLIKESGATYAPAWDDFKTYCQGKTLKQTWDGLAQFVKDGTPSMAARVDKTATLT